MTYKKKRIVSIWIILFICLNFLLPNQIKAEETRPFKINKKYIESVNGGRTFFKNDVEVEERIDKLIEIKFKEKKVYVEKDYSGLYIKQGNKKYEIGKDRITSSESGLRDLREVKSITIPEEIWDSEETTLTADYLGQNGQVEKIVDWPLVTRSPKTIENVGQEEQIDTRPPMKTRAGKAISRADSNTRTETALPKTQINIYKIYYEDGDLFNKHNSQPQGYEENEQLYEYIENNQIRYGHLDDGENLVSKGGTTIGIEKDNFDKYFKGAEKLAGAYFEIRKDDEIVDSGYTDETGVLSFDLEPGNYRIDENLEKSDYRRISDGRRIDGAYRQRALPIHLDLPVLNNYQEDSEKGYIKKIHLYPKNTVIKPLIEKKLVYKWDENTFLDKNANDFEVGEDIYWQIDLSLPVKTSYQDLKILDLASQGIDLEGLEKLSLNGGKMDEDLYKLKEKNKIDDFYIGQLYPDKKLEDYYQNRKTYELSLTEKGLEKINTSLAQDLDDVKISLIVKGNLNGDFYIERQKDSPDLFNRNMAILDYQVVDNYQVLDYDISEVRTGGRQFIKKNTLDEKLEGAEFLVLKKNHKDYEYLIIKDNHFIDWTKDPAQASIFESGQDGVLRTKQAYADRLLKGLRDGRYYLEEIKAPEDYGKLVNLKEFLITRNSFYGQDSLEIINTRLVLPETGSIGSIIFIAFGLLLIGLGYKFKNRKKR